MPMMVGLVKPADEHPLRVETVEGTGLLVAPGRGLGITARHVALALPVVAPELVSIPQMFNGPISPLVDTRPKQPIATFDQERVERRRP
jgi:hypothetical protein